MKWVWGTVAIAGSAERVNCEQICRIRSYQSSDGRSYTVLHFADGKPVSYMEPMEHFDGTREKTWKPDP